MRNKIGGIFLFCHVGILEMYQNRVEPTSAGLSLQPAAASVLVPGRKSWSWIDYSILVPLEDTTCRNTFATAHNFNSYFFCTSLVYLSPTFDRESD